jgi:hypothetical protein
MSSRIITYTWPQNGDSDNVFIAELNRQGHDGPDLVEDGALRRPRRRKECPAAQRTW